MWRPKSIQKYQVLAAKKTELKLEDDSLRLIHYVSSVVVSTP